jgi:hypothetical protein
VCRKICQDVCVIHGKKKVRKFPVPRRDVTTKLSLGGNNDVITVLFLPRGSLVSDIPSGDGKLVNLFYGVDAAFGMMFQDHRRLSVSFFRVKNGRLLLF